MTMIHYTFVYCVLLRVPEIWTVGLWSRAKLRDCDSLNINQSPLCRINNRRYGEETEYQERVVQWCRWWWCRWWY